MMNAGGSFKVKHITTKQFQMFSDIDLVWDFLVEIHDRGWANGVAAPFFEYAITSSWMDKSYQHLNRLWFDGNRVIAFVFNEAPVTDIYFCLRPGYEDLADELVDYAEAVMPNFENMRRFIVYGKQEALTRILVERKYKIEYKYEDLVIDFEQAELNYDLPKGFHFVDPLKADPEKLALCCWKGFNHEDKGPFEKWREKDPGTEWNPVKQYNGVLGALIAPPPHSTNEYNVIIANENEDYVCYSGMWWVPENNLAYMEPLCTIPEYRKMGLAAAALSMHYHQLKALGAKYMTGGSDEFYKKIGYSEGVTWVIWKKEM